ncbi:MAG: CocE/NonD family hydrolase, partial [Candidatus Latescibacteria bacterium]|nr:CocE/NonD family hydrolase [Candidatus Latescibacterota bacterium]
QVKMIIGPFDHAMSPPPETDMVFGDWSSLDINAIENQWLDYWVLGIDNGAEERPAVEFFLLGENRWVSADSWPPASASERSFYLHSMGLANTSDGNGVLDEQKPGNEPLDRFVYDPGDPVPTKGGSICCLRKMTKAGPYDHSMIEKRNDILVYTTGILTEDLTVAGPVELDIYASTSARDTDFTGKLVDIYPDGKAINITDGIIRARFRNGMSDPDFVSPGDVVRYQIELGSAAITFQKGHRIRLEVSSSNFPRFDRNLNTGGRIGKESVFEKAEQHIYHNSSHPSRLVLTVVDSL